MRDLNVSDIYNESEINKLLTHKEKPNIDSVQFDVQSHLSAILDNMWQKFTINQVWEKEIISDQLIEEIISEHIENYDSVVEIDVPENDHKNKEEYKNSEVNLKKYSLMDIRNFNLMNKEQIKELFLKWFSIDIESKKWLEELNKYYTEAKRIFCDRYWKKLPYNLKQDLNWVDDIQKIFKATWSSLHWVYYCALSKLFYAYASFMKDIRVWKIDDIHEEINEYLFTSIHTKEEIDLGRIDGKVNIDWIDIGVNLMHRSKTIDSIVWKAAWNIDYNEVDDYKDLHWYNLEIDTQKDEDIILVMQQYYLKLIQKAELTQEGNWTIKPDIEIENKNMIEIEDFWDGRYYIPALEKLRDQLDSDFYEIMEKSIIKSVKKSKDKADKKSTDHKYQDIKFKVKYWTNDPRWKDLEYIYSWVEIKFTKKWNENEKWSAFHPIFDYAKRFRELTRLVWYIRHTDILNFVNDFFNQLTDTLNYKWMNRWPFLQDLLFDLKEKWYIDKSVEYKIGCNEVELEIRKGLYKMYESSLIKVKSSKNSRKYFYIHKSYYDLVPDIQPELHKIN